MSQDPQESIFVYVDQPYEVSAQVLEPADQGRVIVGLFANGRKLAERAVQPEEFDVLRASRVLRVPRQIGLLVTADDATGLYGSLALLIEDPADLPGHQEAETEPWSAASAEAEKTNRVPILFTLGKAFRPSAARKFETAQEEAIDMLHTLLFAPVQEKPQDVDQAIEQLLRDVQ